MAKRVTIEMVAKEAGVSRGTVDRVINCRPHVKPEQHERVMRAIHALGYEPKRRQAHALGIEIKEREIRRLGVLLPDRDPHYLSELRRGIRDGQAQLSDYSAEILVEQCESSYPEEILKRMNALVDQGIHGLIMSAADLEPIAERINLLCENGIPVVTYDTDIPNSRRLFFFGQDTARIGSVAGGLMASYLSPGDTILVGLGSREMEEDARRLHAFTTAVERRGFSSEQIEVVETFNDYTMTYKKVRQLLESRDDIRGVYMASHSLTGCMDAVRLSEYRRLACVINSDITDRATRYLSSGELDFCVTPNTYQQSYRPLIMLHDYLKDGTLPDGTDRGSEIEIICRENVGSY